MKHRDRLFMDIAIRMSEESTCARMKVGSVIVKDRRIISTGYNGVPSRMKHCEDWMMEYARKEHCQSIDYLYDKVGRVEFKRIHAEYSKYEIHAEQNALNFAAKHGIAVEGATLYTTLSPCLSCSASVLSAGIERVVFLDKYDREDGVDYLKKNGIEVFHFKPQK